MEKRYKSKSIIALTVRKGGRTLLIEFIHTSKGTSYYRTSDTVIQEAIESCSYFKRGVITCEEFAEQTAVSQEGGQELKSALKVHGEITKCVDAIELLRTEYGITAPLTNKQKIQEAAKDAGVSFPNL